MIRIICVGVPWVSKAIISITDEISYERIYCVKHNIQVTHLCNILHIIVLYFHICLDSAKTSSLYHSNNFHAVVVAVLDYISQHVFKCFGMPWELLEEIVRMLSLVCVVLT